MYGPGEALGIEIIPKWTMDGQISDFITLIIC